MLAVFVVSIYEVGDAGREVDQVRQDTELASVALGPGALITALQNERNDTATTLVGLREALELETEDLAASQQVTDDAAEGFRATLARSGPEAERVYASSLEELETTLVTLRERTAESPGAASLIDPKKVKLSNEQFDDYSAIIDQFLDANTRLSLLIEDPELRSATQMLDALSRQFESLAVMVRTGAFSSLGGADVKGTTTEDVLVSINQMEADTDRIELLATGSYAEDARGFGDNPAYEKAAQMLRGYVGGADIDVLDLINAAGDTGVADDVGVVTTESLTADTASALEARSNDLLDDAENRQRNFIGLSLLVLLVGGAFMVIAARSITRPLLSLTKQADDMATHRLPSAVQQILDTPLGEDVVIPDVTPVQVKTRDEVQDVAVALNSVQSSALDLALEQAVLRRNIADSFVNLGRRTQNLIGRQLDFITELERNETDPSTLDNLFKLDHLATRARRNAESLVVLAGLVTPRTWGAPIAMGDIIRAALGEIEDYQRVEVRPIGDAMFPGAAASDLVHLLAELLENGLSFSPPGRPVEVHGRMTKNGYVLAVVDQGIGMTAEELASANERLAGQESYTVAPSRYLGHYVAGNLAQRIGVEVTLSESPTGGVSAKIVIPAAVLDAVPDMPGLAPPAQGGPATGNSKGDSGPTATPDAPASTDATVSDGPVPTTKHGLRRRVPRSDSADGPTVRTGPAPAQSSPAASPAPAATPAPAVPVASAPVAKSAPPAPVPAETATAPEPPLAPRAPAPVASASRATKDAPTASQQVGPSAPVTWAPEAGPVTEARPTPAMPEAAAPAAPANKTANGLRKRVPGDQLAASSLAPMIPRGKTAPPETDGPSPSGPASADSMFSLLSTFESGVQRGRTDFTSTSDPDATAPAPDSDGEV
ncbi:MAG: nitrate- and nitrite sensing domain-containing protein [Aquihabitans sp.]